MKEGKSFEERFIEFANDPEIADYFLNLIIKSMDRYFELKYSEPS
jgi:hypothetical protein